jgi:hypothetical protein
VADATLLGRDALEKFAVDTLPEMHKEEPQRTTEAVWRALSSLLKLARYEARAVARRDEVIRTLVLRKSISLTTKD